MNKRQAKKKRKAVTLPKRRKKQLFRQKKGSQGYKIYDVKAKDVTEKDIKWLVKTLNKRLYNLEKKGLEDISQEYRAIKHYATSELKGKGKMYNVDYEKGTIRITSDLSRFETQEEKTYFINTLRNIYKSRTSTATGTKAVLKESYKKFLETTEKTSKEIPFEKYADIWKTYREVVSEAKKEKSASDVIIELITNTNFYDLSTEEMVEAMEVMNNYEDVWEAGQDIVETLVQWNNTEDQEEK